MHGSMLKHICSSPDSIHRTECIGWHDVYAFTFCYDVMMMMLLLLLLHYYACVNWTTTLLCVFLVVLPLQTTTYAFCLSVLFFWINSSKSNSLRMDFLFTISGQSEGSVFFSHFITSFHIFYRMVLTNSLRIIDLHLIRSFARIYCILIGFQFVRGNSRQKIIYFANEFNSRKA